MKTSIIHNSFTIERTYSAKPPRVFGAYANPEQKRRWFAEGEGFIVDSYSLDFQVGGFERCRFRFGADGPSMTFDGVYMDIVPNQRIVMAYSMATAGAPMSSSLSAIELLPTPAGTCMSYTEHTAYVDGNDGSVGRREGSIDLLEALARELEAHG